MVKRNILLHFSLFLGFTLIALFAGAQIELEPFAAGFTRPLAISNAGDGRLFVVEQAGKIKIVDSTGTTNPVPFMDISSRVKSTGNEQGLLGLAFHPDYSENGYLYVNYTNLNGNTMISRFSVSGTNSEIVDTESELTILSFDQPYANHNGGDLKFGPDDYLYIGTGDGGSAGDPQANAQNLTEFLGKMLRIDVDGGSPYVIPESNPYTDSIGALDEIWASGLRNPWRYSFDRKTGDLWIADVGQKVKEEINLQLANSAGGENYGWRCYEGNDPYNGLNCLSIDTYDFPVHEYSHNATGGCSVTGGFVYRGGNYPALEGYYFFADYCTDQIWSLHDKEGTMTLTDYGKFPENKFSTFGEDRDGEIYIAGLASGSVYRLKGPDPTSNYQMGESHGYQIYPNPVLDRVWINALTSKGDRVDISIYNSRGELLYLKRSQQIPVSLDLGFLEPGMYFIGVNNQGWGEFTKLIKTE